MNNKTSLKIYIFLVILLSILAAINVYMPQGDFAQNIPREELPASKPIMAIVNALSMLLVYGGLGYIGLRLSKKLGFPVIWDEDVSNKQRFIVPLAVGVMIGIFFIIADVVLSRFHNFGELPHPPFPTSLTASLVAGIGEELIFRLFFISFWVWLISYVIMKKKYQKTVFWSIALISAVAFSVAHLPSIMMLYGINEIIQVPIAILVEVLLLNSTLSIFAAYLFKKYGILAAIGVHFWTDVVWHVVWGLM